MPNTYPSGTDGPYMENGMKKIVLTITLTFWSASAHATNWYVDNAASGANSGTSWANAWTSPSSITGSSVQPGDTVYISGGTTSKTYSISSMPTKNGTAGNIITLSTGQEPGHNGTVIWQVTGSNWLSGSKSYMHITGNVGGAQKMEIQGLSGSDYIWSGNASGSTNFHLSYVRIINTPGGFMFSAGAPADFEMDHIYVFKVYGTTSTSDATFWGLSESGCTYDRYKVHHSEFYIPNSTTNSLGGDDMMIWGGNFSFYNNYFKKYFSGSSPQGQHADGWQVKGNCIKVYNNVLEDNVESWFYHDSAFNRLDISNVYIYNNITFQTSAYSGNSYHWFANFEPELGGAGSNFTNVCICNNTIVDFTDALYIVNFSGIGSCTNCRAANNLILNSQNNGRYGYSQMINTCCGATKANNVESKSAVPAGEFVSYTKYSPNNNFHLTTSATNAINQGIDVVSAYGFPSFLAVDKDGVSRPQGSGWDLGAYEFHSGVGATLNPPSNLTVQ
jgi:hypothetical protein